MSTLLTIAGSDPSGGAGIQQDLKVFASLRNDGLSAVTAITVQNGKVVSAVHPVSAEILAAQIEAVMNGNRRLRGVKIGMLGGAEQIVAVGSAIRLYNPPNIVLDPVLASSDGVALLDPAARSVLLTVLMPLCDLITPNLNEAALLTGSDAIIDELGIRRAGQKLLDLGARAVLVKGGHLRGAPTDYLFTHDQSEPTIISGNRIDTDDTHGTGCYLSSAITSFLTMGVGLKMAVEMAKAHLERGLRNAIGTGYPDAFAHEAPKMPWRKHPMQLIHGLYVVTDSELRAGRSHVDITRAALAGGAKIIQLRDKVLSTAALITLGSEIRELCSASGALYIVNDRLDVALATDADGIHVGADDISPLDARRLFRDHRIVGVSVNSVEEARAARPFATYFGVGAIFGTTTKGDAGAAIGVARIREIKANFPDVSPGFPFPPIVAIGGINLSNIDSVIAAGADSAAVISAVVCAPDMQTATAELVSRFPA